MKSSDGRIRLRRPSGAIGEVIELELRKRGWSTYRLAQEAGIARRATVSDVLSGRVTSEVVVNRVLAPLGLVYRPNTGGVVSSI
jgi:plasmid maintenance system antidote protein VapI